MPLSAFILSAILFPSFPISFPLMDSFFMSGRYIYHNFSTPLSVMPFLSNDNAWSVLNLLRNSIPSSPIAF